MGSARDRGDWHDRTRFHLVFRTKSVASLARVPSTCLQRVISVVVKVMYFMLSARLGGIHATHAWTMFPSKRLLMSTRPRDTPKSPKILYAAFRNPSKPSATLPLTALLANSACLPALSGGLLSCLIG